MTGPNIERSDIFISYSRKDEELAERVCKFLENCGIRCWLAHRDAVDGQPFDRQISKVIALTHATMVILSANANASEYVRSEVAIAFDHKKTIFVVRMEDVTPAEGLDVFLKLKHWTSAFPPPAEDKLLRLANAMLALWGGPPVTEKPKPDTRSTPVSTAYAAAHTPADPANHTTARASIEPRIQDQPQTIHGSTSIVFTKQEATLYLEPGVESRLRLSAAAALLILRKSQYAGKRWLHVRCADGLGAWIDEAVTTTQDPRVFFRMEHDPTPLVGFLQNHVYVADNWIGSFGSLHQIWLKDPDLGKITIDLVRIREITINRRDADAPVRVITDQRSYRGEFEGAEPPYCVLLVISRPFVRLLDVRNEISLSTVDYASLQRTDAPKDY